MNRRIYILSAMLLFAVGMSSCRYNELEPDGDTSSTPVVEESPLSFVVGTASPATRSAMASKSEGVKAFLCEEGQDSLFLVSSVSENRDDVFASDAPATKGEPVTTENLTDFYISGYFDSTLKYFEIAHVGESDKTVIDGRPVYTLDYYWPSDDTELDFYATNFNPGTGMMPADEWEAAYGDVSTKTSSIEQYNSVSVSWEQDLLSFGYDAQDNSKGGFCYSLPEPDVALKNDAENQPDYVFAIAPDRVDDGAPVPLDFAHCFSAVTFKFGSDFLNPDGRQVKEVKISGVPSSGVCNFTSLDGQIDFSWNTTGVDRKTYIQAIPYEGTETNVANGTVINDGQMTFMLIPHEIYDDAKITITIDMHKGCDETYQHTIVIEKSIKDLFAEGTDAAWEAGKKYVYTIVSEEKVDVEITDEFTSTDPMVKGNLEITNTGNAGIYVRAYIVGWWENETGDMVSPWLSSQGEWSGASWETSGNWTIVDDGFFYYKEPLWPGESTEKLFETYTLTSESPVVGSHLVLNVVTQAVVHYMVEQAWPNFPSNKYE